jgi:hypothetical protein
LIAAILGGRDDDHDNVQSERDFFAPSSGMETGIYRSVSGKSVTRDPSCDRLSSASDDIEADHRSSPDDEGRLADCDYLLRVD